MRLAVAAALALRLATGAPALAQAPPAGMPAFRMEAVPRPAEAPPEQLLYPGVAPGSEGARQVEAWGRLSTPDGSSGYIVRNVTRPSFSVVLPAPGKATGAAVILAPGGAFLSLSMTTEGWQAARWFADHGVAAFVLKYRLDETPADMGAFQAVVGQRMGAAAAAGGAGAPPITNALATADGQAMVRLLRSRAREFGIDPHRIGFVGFSAGAMTALSVTLADEPASRPDFTALLYPPMNAVAVPADAPPLFVALAQDDLLFGSMGFGLVSSWRKANKPIELHYYQGGDHGFGTRKTGTTSEHWAEELLWWMGAQHLLGAALRP